MDKHNIRVHVLKLLHRTAFLGPQMHGVALITLVGSQLSFINSLDKVPLCVILLYYFLLLHFPSLFSFPGTMLGGINGQLYFINDNAMR